MTAPQAAPPTAKTARLIHGAMVTGVVSFALISHFVIRPSIAAQEDFPAAAVPVLLGLSVAACAVALLLRTRVPRRATDESADLFWRKAATPALIAWAPLEAASLLGVFLYAFTGSQPAIAVAAVALLMFVMLNPWYLERR